MEWTTYNVSVARLMGRIIEADPAALVRFDFTGEGWGFSYCPDSALPNGAVEVYGEGMTPKAALEDAINKWYAILDAA